MNAPLLRCHEARPYLSAYADDELDPSLQEQVAAHLATCLSCRPIVARYQAVDALLSGLPASSPSPDVLDRVLAATSSVNKERATRESLRQPEKPLAQRSLPAFLLPNMQQMTPLLPSQQLAQKRRSWLIAGALPTLAALLIVTLTLVAFHERPSGATAVRPTPILNRATVLQDTAQRMQQYTRRVQFTPIIPTYLPPGAQMQSVHTGTQDNGAKYLDVTLTLGAPFTVLHLREVAEPLNYRTDYVTTTPNTEQTWQLAGPEVTDPQWIPMRPGGDSYGHLVVGQDRGSLSITLDIGMRDNTFSTETQALTYLRLVSLSLDAQHQFLSGIPAPDSSTVAYYEARTIDGQYVWKVYSDSPDPQHPRAKAALYTSAGAWVYTDYLIGSIVTRYDPSGYTESIPASLLSDPFTLGNKVGTFFGNIYSYIGNGELWSLGANHALPPSLQLAGVSSRSPYALVLVNGPQPTTIYVDSNSNRVIGVTVNTTSSTHPGGVQATFFLQSQSCLSYTLIAYVPANSMPASSGLAFPASNGATRNIPSVEGC